MLTLADEFKYYVIMKMIYIQSKVKEVAPNDYLLLAKEKMYADFGRLLSASDDVRKAWKGSKADLYEMAYRAYLADRITDSEGVPLTFQEVVRILCSRFHIYQPHNAYAIAKAACNRRGIRSHTLLKRYEWKLKHGIR